MKEEVLKNIDKIHTTKLGKERIKKNLQLNKDDIVTWCKEAIVSKESLIIKNGKNYYITLNDYFITVNANSYTIITAKKKNNPYIEKEL